MVEVFFILIILFGIYIILKIDTETKSEKAEPEKSAADSALSKIDVVAVKEEKKVAKPVVAAKKPKATTATKKTATKKVATKKAVTKNLDTMPTGYLRDPKTGDEVKISNTYRMLRRWIKEALVSEGLLDKIYNTSELESATITQKVYKAVGNLKKIEQYKAIDKK
ncbi:MAG: hypothetical protein KAG19_03500 [Methylococcales bacterium]|nr:hypothetical protein [Methylococcales bacterium]